MQQGNLASALPRSQRLFTAALGHEPGHAERPDVVEQGRSEAAAGAAGRASAAATYWNCINNLDQKIMVLDQAAEKAAQENEMARLLMTQPGVGPVTSLACVLSLGDVTLVP